MLAQWLERTIEDRVIVGSNRRPLGNFKNFLYPTLPDTESRCSRGLSGVYAKGSKISHTSWDI